MPPSCCCVTRWVHFGIFSATREVPHCFDVRTGNKHIGKFSGTMKTSKCNGVTRVGFNPIRWTLGYIGGRTDRTVEPLFCQRAEHVVTTSAGFTHKMHLFACCNQLFYQAIKVVKTATNDAITSDLSIATSICKATRSFCVHPNQQM